LTKADSAPKGLNELGIAVLTQIGFLNFFSPRSQHFYASGEWAEQDIQDGDSGSNKQGKEWSVACS
jgi:hypothetical protein